MKTIYNYLQSKKKSPEDLLGKKILFWARSQNDNFAFGIFNKILAEEVPGEEYGPRNPLELTFGFLDQTPQQMLKYMAHFVRLAESKGYKLGSDNN